MKYEESRDLITILVEPSDDAMFVMSWIDERYDLTMPVLLILPVNASQVFGYPDAILALRHLQDERAGTVLLVIPGNAGNERLRSWAAQQGFPVFATVEACTRTFAPHGPLSVQQQYAQRGALSPTGHALRTRRRVADPGVISQPFAVPVGVTVAFEPSEPVLKTTDELQPAVIKRMETEQLILKDGPTAARIADYHRQNTFMLVLVVLLILSILGGVGFGYLLTTIHQVAAEAVQLIRVGL